MTSSAGTSSSFGSNFAGFLNKKAVYITLIAVTILMLIVFIVWLVIRIRRGNLQSIRLTDKVYNLYTKDVPYVVDSAKTPATTNGQEFSYSFWIYLQSLDPSSEHKLLFIRSPDATTSPVNAVYTNASPIVFLDKLTNKIYITLPTTNLQTNIPLDVFTVPNGNVTHVTSIINYVPLQRWVHVAFTMQDNSISTYIDGTLYSVYTIPEPPSGSSISRPVFKNTVGSIQIGEAANRPRANISKLQFYNYAMTQRQVQSVYAAGPAVSSFLSKFGLPYGLRYPIFRTDG
jgi:hypothetical protein